MLMQRATACSKLRIKIVDECRGIFRTLSNIYDGAFSRNYQLLAFNYFRKSVPSYMIDRILSATLESAKC